MGFRDHVLVGVVVKPHGLVLFPPFQSGREMICKNEAERSRKVAVGFRDHVLVVEVTWFCFVPYFSKWERNLNECIPWPC